MRALLSRLFRWGTSLAVVGLGGLVLAGCHKPYTFGDFVWLDANSNGIQDEGEPGVAGVGVQACSYTDSSDYSCVTSTTDDEGRWVYRAPSDVRDATYVEIRFTLPPGYLPTLSNVGEDDTVDSDGQGVDLGPFTHDTAGLDDDTIDLGLIQRDITIGDFVWRDLDGNGAQDPGEPGVEGIPVVLVDTAGTVVATAATDSQGIYALGPVVSGEYRVRFGPLPTGLAFTQVFADDDFQLDSDADPATGESDIRNFLSTVTSVDAGVVGEVMPPEGGEIGDLVWRDFDFDGIQDPGEPGIEGIVVELRNGGDFTIDEVVTDGGGRYRFSGLAAGTYQVRFVAPSGFSFTAPDQGGDDTIDSDARAGGVTDLIDLGSVEIDVSVDAGFIPLG